jgi:hypothetical protein
MKRSEVKGICAYCKSEIPKSKSSIIKHLGQCTVRNSRKIIRGGPNLLLLLEGAYAPDYWLVVKVKPDATMQKIDEFIKAIWVECCGHLSRFSYGKNLYGDDEIAMSRKANAVFKDGVNIIYEYDFGTPTVISLSSFGEIDDADGKDILVLFRNKEIEAKCSYCGKKAVEICPYCIYDDKGLLCKSCLKTHPCVKKEGEEAMLPLVNSPRAGECGYTGPFGKGSLDPYFPKGEF